jgi:hypothetical protein
MATVIITGDAVITLNQVKTFPKPEIVRKALIDHMDMANKYKLKVFFKVVSGLELITNAKITP